MARIRSAVAGMAFVALGYFSFLNYIAGDEEEIVFSDVTVHLPGSTHKSESSTSGITRRDTQGLVNLVLRLITQSMTQAQEQKAEETLPPVQVLELYTSTEPSLQVVGEPPSLRLIYKDEKDRERLVQYYNCGSFEGLCADSDKVDLQVLRHFKPNIEVRMDYIDHEDGSSVTLKFESRRYDPSDPTSSASKTISRSEYDPEGKHRKKWYSSTDDGSDCSSFENVVSYHPGASGSSGYITRRLTNGKFTPNDILVVVDYLYSFYGGDDTCEYLVHEIPPSESGAKLIARCNNQLTPN